MLYQPMYAAMWQCVEPKPAQNEGNRLHAMQTLAKVVATLLGLMTS